MDTGIAFETWTSVGYAGRRMQDGGCWKEGQGVRKEEMREVGGGGRAKNVQQWDQLDKNMRSAN